MDKNILLGDKSYGAILGSIHNKIQKTNCTTLQGQNLCRDIYIKLNESNTPILELKEFNTNAKEVSDDDASLKDILDFCETKIKTADLNFLINLAKEEHFRNLSRSGYPDPKITIKNIETEFNQPSSIIEESIKSGIFDGLESNLLKEIKTSLSIEKDLSESTKKPSYYIGANVVKYSPVGIKFEDLKNDRMVILTESVTLGYDRAIENFKPLDSTKVDIPSSIQKLHIAIESCNYNPETKEFMLPGNWDFELKLLPDCSVKVNEKKIGKDLLKNLLLESINEYEKFPTKVQNFNKKQYLKNADNFILLCENANRLTCFENLEVFRNLSEQNYILLDKDSVYNSNTPQILGSNKGSKLFESYNEMLNESNNILGFDLNPLFESQLKNENDLISFRNSEIVRLNEQQKLLNESIDKCSNLKSMADEDSPAMKRLDEQDQTLQLKLTENLKSLNDLKNNFELYPSK